MKKFTATDSLGQIVATFPSAGDYFMTHHIDFCCGGERSLAEALTEQKLSEKNILEPLNELYAAFQERNEVFEDWAQADKGKLIDHILTAHHKFLREELPAISVLLFKLLGVHGKHHQELFEVHHTFNLLRLELESHLIKEEVWLFPAVVAYELEKRPEQLTEIKLLLETLEAEHVGAGDLIKALREITDHYTVPEDGCTTFALTYAKLQALEKNTFEHIHLENNILFKNL